MAECKHSSSATTTDSVEHVASATDTRSTSSLPRSGRSTSSCQHSIKQAPITRKRKPTDRKHNNSSQNMPSRSANTTPMLCSWHSTCTNNKTRPSASPRNEGSESDHRNPYHQTLHHSDRTAEDSRPTGNRNGNRCSRCRIATPFSNLRLRQEMCLPSFRRPKQTQSGTSIMNEPDYEDQS